MIAARRDAVLEQVDGAPTAWRAWAERELTRIPDVPHAEGRDAAWDGAREASVREGLGQVFTPDPLARALVAFARLERPGDVLDPAVGDGSLLRAVADVRARAGLRPGAVLDGLVGWDVDPGALALARLALVRWGLAHPSGDPPGPLRLEVRDALGHGGGPFAHVVGNPPYLEAKRMGRSRPGLREALRARFPQLVGAFDLWLAFAWRALELAPDGSVALLLPNRVMQGRYAASFRAHVREQGLLAGLLDLGALTPRPFPGTGVYPAFVHLERSATVRVGRVRTSEALQQPRIAEVPAGELDVGGEGPWFVPFSTWPALAGLFGSQRLVLGDVAEIRSTCSFHLRGQRERYVTPTRPDVHAHPYVGGPSRARQNEVRVFGLDWAGWWIRYDEQALRDEGNPLPPLGLFLQPKILFNQHDRRMTPTIDREGRVTKDVVPVAWATHPDWTLGRLCAVLASTVFTALYNTLFQGVVVGGETYHYLPAFLRQIPVPRGDHPALADADARVDALHVRFDPAAWDALDAQVAEAYGVGEEDRQSMIDVHLVRVGAPAPGRP